MNDTLASKVAIVTGAGRGIGRAIARRLAQHGATVVVATRSPAPGEDTVAQIVADGGNASLFALNVTDRDAVRRLVNDTGDRCGRIDIIVHAAADIPYSRIATLSDADFDLCPTSVLKSAFWLVKDALPWLKASGAGRVVFISSTEGNRSAVKGLSHYGAAKAGLNAFARGAALEFARDGITVNTIDPGLIASDRMRSLVPPEQEATLAARFPVDRAGTPDEIAASVLHLVQPESGYITGASLVIDGGASL